MILRLPSSWVLAAVLVGGAQSRSPISEKDARAMVVTASCTTTKCLETSYATIRNPRNAATIVYFSGRLRINPSDRTAACGLLANIPKDKAQYEELSLLGANLYPGETDRQIRLIGRSYWQMSLMLAHALTLCPHYLPEFIRYGRLAAQAPSEDDYANWAAKVCRSNPNQFLIAFQKLSPSDRHYIAQYVIQPRGCKQIAYPEAQ